MVSFRTLLASGPLLASTLAAPTTPVSRQFHIAISGASDESGLNGQFLHAFHTGAGLADPTFDTNATSAAKAYISEGKLLLDLGTQFPFAVNAPLGDTNYARWEFVTITAGGGSENFRNTADNELLGDFNTESFAGWVVCQWYHGDNLPQLFVAIDGFTGGPQGQDGVPNLPGTCSNVNLSVQYI